MNYFKSFPATSYSFGKDEDPVAFQDLSAYVDLIDNVKDRATFYTYHYIKDGERPDHISQQLYETTAYHWTFFLLNDTIRRQGWPLDYNDARTYAESIFDNTTIRTQDEMFDTFQVGQTVLGSQSGATGTILRRNLDNGQLVIEGSLSFQSGETVTSNGATESIEIVSHSEEYNALHHYVDSDGDYVDVSPFDPDPGIYTIVTNKEHYINKNEELKKIRVFKPADARGIVSQFKKAMIKGV